MSRKLPENALAADVAKALLSPSVRGSLQDEATRHQKRRRLMRRLLPPTVFIAVGGILVASGEVSYKFFDSSKPAKNVPSEPDKFMSMHSSTAQPTILPKTAIPQLRHETSTGRHANSVVRTIDKAAPRITEVHTTPTSPDNVPTPGANLPSGSQTGPAKRPHTGSNTTVGGGATAFKPPVPVGGPTTPPHVYQPGETVIPNPTGNSTERNAYQLTCQVDPANPICKPS